MTSARFDVKCEKRRKALLLFVTTRSRQTKKQEQEQKCLDDLAVRGTGCQALLEASHSL
jgi:hypothetical protein